MEAAKTQLRVQIDHVLRLVRQVRARVLQLRNPAVRVGFRHPLFVGNPLVLPLLVETPKLFIGRVFDALLLFEQTPQILFQSSPVSRRTIDFIAASASKVVASTATVLPGNNPFSAASASTH